MSSAWAATSAETPGVVYAGEFAAQCAQSYFALWGLPHLPKRNPCAQPVSLERKHIPLLLAGDYVVADKSDGVRYTLYLCREGGRNFSFLIDRKLSFYQIPVAASKRAFAGSIFDGELVWSLTPQGTRSQLFLVFDVVAYRGSAAIQQESLHKRLETIRSAFDLSGRPVVSPECAAALAKEGKIICGGNSHGLSFRPKPCFPMDQLDTLLRQIPSLPYATDGLVFTPVDQPLCAGTAERTFKLKASHTVDLEVRGGDLLLGQGGSPETAVQRVSLATLGIPFRRDAALQAEIDALAVGPDQAPVILECALSLKEKDAELSYIGRRTDKVHPNVVRTVLSTLTNLREDIKPQELCAAQRGGGSHRETNEGTLPKPVCCEPSSQGGAELASLAVGDVLDSQRFAGPFLSSSPA